MSLERLDETGREVGDAGPATVRMWEAIRRQDIPALKASLLEGANPNGLNKYQSSAIYELLDLQVPDNLDVTNESIALLLHHGASPIIGHPPRRIELLFKAVVHENQTVVKWLLDHGADPNGVRDNSPMWGLAFRKLYLSHSSDRGEEVSWQKQRDRLDEITDLLMKKGARLEGLKDSLGRSLESVLRDNEGDSVMDELVARREKVILEDISNPVMPIKKRMNIL